MTFAKGHKLSPGRKKGVPNKITANIKDAFADAFEKRGGSQALYQWSLDNATEFYKLASKLIPADINNKVEGDVNVFIKQFSPIKK